jgi:hypothetical protein
MYSSVLRNEVGRNNTQERNFRFKKTKGGGKYIDNREYLNIAHILGQLFPLPLFSSFSNE